MKRARRWLKCGACLLLLAGLLLVLFAPGRVLPPIARFLNVSETPRPVEYVLVLNGDPEIRPFAAAALVKAGLAQEVLLTRQRLSLESSSVQDGAMLSELEITRRVLHARDVAQQAIRVLPGEVTSTADEAAALAVFLNNHPGATAAIVTNAFHTRRARMLFRRALGEDVGRIYFVGVPRDWVDEANWWQTQQGCAAYLSEYSKYAYCYFRG